MPRPYIVPIVSDFVATPLRSGALVLSTSSSSFFTILLDTKELSDPVSKIILGITIVLALSGVIILVFIVIIISGSQCQYQQAFINYHQYASYLNHPLCE